MISWMKRLSKGKSKTNENPVDMSMKEQQTYVSFLRYSLERETAQLPAGLDKMNWQGLFDFSQRHCVLGVVFEAIARLDKSVPHPHTALLMKWFSFCEHVKKTNMRINAEAVALSKRFSKDGFRSCILKGQGNTTMYPNPLARMPGDIDVWVEGKEADILNYARQYDAKAIANYHHVQLEIKGVSTVVEIHFTPSFCGNLFYNARMRKYFATHAEQQFEHKVALPDGVGEISIPTPGFNRIFQLSHTMHHFFFEGIGLRQIVDYYYLLKIDLSDEEKEEEVKVLKYLGMYKFATAMMYVQHEVLGLDTKYMSVQPDEKLGKLFLKEILQAGNFGFYDERYHFTGKSRVGQYLLEVFRNLHYAWYYPGEAIFGRPIFRIWHQFKKRSIENEAERCTKIWDDFDPVINVG